MDCCKFSYFSDKKDFVAIKTVIMTMKSTFMLMIPRNIIWNRKNSDKVFCIYPKNSGAGAFKVKL